MILVDAHVHIHDCFDLQTFFDSALDNFEAEANKWRRNEPFTGILLLAETSEQKWFERAAELAASTHNPIVKEWSFHQTKEACSLLLQRDDGRRSYVIAGRQIVTAEGLEVLALATDRCFKDGAPFKQTIQTIQQSDAMLVIPWGFGKWTGHRGSIVKDLLQNNDVPGLFLGDNGNRPFFWLRPAHFQLAEQIGIAVLPGSDPLPFRSQYSRAGSFGFAAKGTITPHYPARDLKRVLSHPSTQVRKYGHLEYPWRFLRNQLALRLRDHGQQPHNL